VDTRLPAVAEAVASLAAGARAGELDGEAALAALTAVRALSAEMEKCELALLDALHGAGVPWSQVAAAMGSPRRQAAQKRRSDLAARHASPAPGSPPGAGEPAAGDASQGEPSGSEAAGDPGSRAGEEPSRPLRHRQVPGLGPEWTFTEPSESSSDAILWRDKATRAGGAREARWPKKGWEPAGPRFWAGIGPSQSSRARALRYAAEKFEHQRRKETPAGPDVPLAGLPGWALRQTLEEKDRRAWRVIAPDGAVAGTVAPAWGGSRHWSASLGDPAREFYHPVAVDPWEAGMAAGDGSDWKTRDAAAYGVAAEHDESVPSPAEALAAAAAERQRRKDARTAGEPA
jgi:hypothetical protein